MNQDIKYLDPGRLVEGQLPTKRPIELRKRESYMSVLKRARFALKDSKGLERLSLQLERYIDALLKMCPHGAAEASTLVQVQY